MKQKKDQNKHTRKIAFIVLGAVVVVFVGCYFAVSHYNKVSFAKAFIEKIGGEQAIKQDCMKNNLGAHHMSDGTTHERYLSTNDIRRVPKMCDCMVEKSYKMVMEMKPKLGPLGIDNLPSDMAALFREMLFINYDACEDEVINWLEKKYKTIDVQ